MNGKWRSLDIVLIVWVFRSEGPGRWHTWWLCFLKVFVCVYRRLLWYFSAISVCSKLTRIATTKTYSSGVCCSYFVFRAISKPIGKTTAPRDAPTERRDRLVMRRGGRRGEHIMSSTSQCCAVFLNYSLRSYESV